MQMQAIGVVGSDEDVRKPLYHMRYETVEHLHHAFNALKRIYWQV